MNVSGDSLATKEMDIWHPDYLGFFILSDENMILIGHVAEEFVKNNPSLFSLTRAPQACIRERTFPMFTLVTRKNANTNYNHLRRFYKSKFKKQISLAATVSVFIRAVLLVDYDVENSSKA